MGNDRLETVLNGIKKLLYLVPLLLIVPVALYAISDDTGKKQMDSLILQTPAKGLISGGYDYYPGYLDSEDVVVYQKEYTDKDGNPQTGAVIEIRRPVVFASPANTGSMEPMFGEGNLLVQEKVNKDTVLNKGDIVVYSYENRLIIHSIVGELEGCYVTKGLNNALPDSVCVTKDMIKYRLIFAIPTK